FDLLLFFMAIGLALMIFILGAMLKYVPAVESGSPSSALPAVQEKKEIPAVKNYPDSKQKTKKYSKKK
ncbi:MAG: hypothetical protein WCT31_02810, partial [Candidatus Micrarchaeia archaeon]